MLPIGEQRTLLVISMLLILMIFARAAVQLLPEKIPPGIEEFVRESRTIMALIQKEDSILQFSRQTEFAESSYSNVPNTHNVTVYSRNKPQVMSPIDINTADSLTLLPLPGIGPVLAGRIIKYRRLLGGFSNIYQLYEVYGLKGETIDMISDHITIDTLTIRKMSLDSSSFRDLLRHPYLQLDDVKALVNYRDYKGRIDSMQELRNNCLLSDSILKKVGPYLDFGN